MENTTRNHNLIKTLLKMLINTEKEMDKFSDYMQNNNFLLNIDIEAKEILCFNDLLDTMEVTSVEKQEKNYELLGDMITKDYDLNIAIDNFMAYNQL